MKWLLFLVLLVSCREDFRGKNIPVKYFELCKASCKAHNGLQDYLAYEYYFQDYCRCMNGTRIQLWDIPEARPDFNNEKEKCK